MKESPAILIVRWFLCCLHGIGVSLILLPLALYWWIHGDHDRYLWIIRRPPPFSNLGSGPYQLRLYGILILAGISLTGVVAILKMYFRKKDLSSLDVHR